MMMSFKGLRPRVIAFAWALLMLPTLATQSVLREFATCPQTSYSQLKLDDFATPEILFYVAALARSIVTFSTELSDVATCTLLDPEQQKRVASLTCSVIEDVLDSSRIFMPTSNGYGARVAKNW